MQMDGFAKYLVRRFFQFFLVIFLGVRWLS